MPDRPTFDAIQMRLDLATPAPWRISPRTHPQHHRWVDNGQYDVVMTQDQPRQEADADFIAHAPTDIAALLAEVRVLQDNIDNPYWKIVAEKARAASIKYRKALEDIASCEVRVPGTVVDIARQALEVNDAQS